MLFHASAFICVSMEAMQTISSILTVPSWKLEVRGWDGVGGRCAALAVRGCRSGGRERARACLHPSLECERARLYFPPVTRTPRSALELVCRAVWGGE